MGVDLDDGTPRDFAAQLKGYFGRQLAAARPAPSRHMTHGARENEQLAEIIGQLQHVIQLAEYAIGRPMLPPVPFTIAQGAASVTLDAPITPCTLVAAVICMGGANSLGVTVTLTAPSFPGGSKVVGQGSLNENAPLTLPLDAFIPPDCTGITITPGSNATSWSGVLTFRPLIPGGYPYAQ